MSNESKATEIRLNDCDPESLQAEKTQYNGDLRQTGAEQARLERELEALRTTAVNFEIEKPERLKSQADKLAEQIIAEWVKEGKLIKTKHERFQDLEIKSRAAERTRCVKLQKKRVAAINKGLDQIGTDTRFRPGIINGDTEVLELKQRIGAVSGFVKVVTEADEARLEWLQVRLAAVVPKV